MAALITLCVLQTTKALNQCFTTKPVTEDSFLANPLKRQFPSNPIEINVFLHSDQKDGIHMSTENVYILMCSRKINLCIFAHFFPFHNSLSEDLE